VSANQAGKSVEEPVGWVTRYPPTQSGRTGAPAQKATENLGQYELSVADRAVMEFLYPQKQLSVPEIASRYQVSRQHVQVTVNALRKKGLIESRPNPRHKRSVLMKLSEKGGELFAEILAKDKQTVERLFSAIPPKDRNTTRRTLETLLRELSREK
jgi:DNA-binding MarR family transcriptional regulator